MDYGTVFSRLLPNISLANNYTIHQDVMDTPTNTLTSWVLLLKYGFSMPSFLPWLLLGPTIHLVTSLLILPFTPSSVIDSSSRRWKWRTTFIARLCAAVTGSWAVFALYTSPALCADLMLTSSISAQRLVIFSLGVHMAEAADMIIHGRPGMLLVHHLLVIICFTGALITGKAVGFAVLSLVTEVNAVFNKTRIIHIITGTAHDSVEYIRNAQLNIFTFFIRILIIGWMNNQCFLYLGVLPLPFLMSCGAGLFIVNIWNLSVFRTLIQKDIIGKHKAN